MADRDRMVAEVHPAVDAEVGAALWRLAEGRERTLRLLAPVSDDIVDRHVRGNSIGTILYHVGLIEADWLYTEILEQPVPDELQRRFPVEDRDADGVLMVVRGQTLEEHLGRLAVVRSALEEALRSMPAEDFHRVRQLPSYDVTPAWVLHHLAQHEAEHRGELGSVLAELRS